MCDLIVVDMNALTMKIVHFDQDVPTILHNDWSLGFSLSNNYAVIFPNFAHFCLIWYGLEVPMTTCLEFLKA